MKNTGLFILVFIVIIIFPGIISAQQSDSLQKPAAFNNSIYIEAFGNGVLPTLNYERLFPVKQSNMALAFRIGGVFIPTGNYDGRLEYEMVTLGEFSMITGKRPLKWEFGFGLTYYGNSDTYYIGNNNLYTSKYHEVIPVFRVGGRWQKPGKPLLIRLAFTPLVFGNDYLLPPVMPFGGLSIGYSFGRRR